jgi:3-oxoacyl-[acyl-carrier-protein] synthase-3
VDLIILATSTPDHLLFPSTACILQRLLEIKRPIPAFDMSAACTGFNYAISTGAQFVASGSAKYVLVVAADVLSKFMDWKDRGTCILFGDGAGAVVLGPTASGCGILTSDLFSNGEFADILRAKHGGSRYSLQENSPLRPLIEMEGKSVFKVAVNTVVPAIETVLAREGVAVSDIKLVVFHQANVRIIDMAKDRLGLSDDQLIITLPLYGNTSAASIPIALNEAVKQGRVVKGDLIVLVGFGAGFTWGVNLVRWCI